jgi:hypothetical protein
VQALFLFPALLGVTVLMISVPLAHARVEPFMSWYYIIAWYGLILFMDSLRAALGKPSLLFKKSLLFPALVFWSAVIWFLFEVFNFRVANWYYIFVSDSKTERIVSSWLAFGTVLPALFLIEKLLEDAGVFVKRPRFTLALGPRGMKVAVLAGTASLILPLALPRQAFPLVWIWGFLLPLPLFARRIERSFLTELGEGKPGRLMRILLAGMICGVIWEFLNYFATIRWIYTVPYLEDLKFFEMPPLGFLGFPPFALECVVLYGVLAGLGIAPAEEKVGACRPGLKSRRPVAVFACLAGLAFGLATLGGMEEYNIDSYTPRPGDLSLPPQVRAVVGEEAYETCFKLERSLQDPVAWALLEKEGVDVRRLHQLVKLCLLRGMGTAHAGTLAGIGVDGMEALGKQDPGRLSEAITGASSGREWSVMRSRAKVWVKAARYYR